MGIGMRFYCETCGEYRGVMVDFNEGRWCLVCSAPLNLECYLPPPPPRFATVVFGQRHVVTVAASQRDVEAKRVRVIDAVDGRPMIVPVGHLHLIHA